LTSVTILAELGDTRRFENSRDAVRYSGLDITVHQSDQRRSPGHLSRQGPPAPALGAVSSSTSRAAPEQLASTQSPGLCDAAQRIRVGERALELGLDDRVDPTPLVPAGVPDRLLALGVGPAGAVGDHVAVVAREQRRSPPDGGC
jgi:hypothetical protein